MQTRIVVRTASYILAVNSVILYVLYWISVQYMSTMNIDTLMLFDFVDCSETSVI